MSNENKIKSYLKGVKQEWSKVTWPEKAQVVSETIWVIMIVALFTIVVLCYDVIFNSIFGIFNK